jgi:hypothetical protein
VGEAARLDRSVARIRDLTGPDDIVLDLAHSPLIHVLTGRRGPGHGDVVTPGVFADPEVERRFVERLRSAPPTLVLWPRRPFDGRADRALDVHAPHLARWVRNHYVPAERERTRALILRRRRLSDAPAGRSS